jgi:hypothetical protein
MDRPLLNIQQSLPHAKTGSIPQSKYSLIIHLLLPGQFIRPCILFATSRPPGSNTAMRVASMKIRGDRQAAMYQIGQTIQHKPT